MRQILNQYSYMIVALALLVGTAALGLIVGGSIPGLVVAVAAIALVAINRYLRPRPDQPNQIRLPVGAIDGPALLVFYSNY